MELNSPKTKNFKGFEEKIENKFYKGQMKEFEKSFK